MAWCDRATNPPADGRRARETRPRTGVIFRDNGFWRAAALGTGDDELGEDVIEFGAGPGLVTDLLLDRAGHVTAVEIDADLAAALRRRLAGRAVEVITADATALPLPGDRFAAAACFTMLHHIPGAALQDRALAEIARVLRPGGLLLGTDGQDTPSRRALHVDDVFEPIDPAGLADRLRAAGFVDPLVDSNGDRFRFRARAAGVR